VLAFASALGSLVSAFHRFEPGRVSAWRAATLRVAAPLSISARIDPLRGKAAVDWKNRLSRSAPSVISF
jgi:hypothetical protein